MDHPPGPAAGKSHSPGGAVKPDNIYSLMIHGIPTLSQISPFVK